MFEMTQKTGAESRTANAGAPSSDRTNCGDFCDDWTGNGDVICQKDIARTVLGRKRTERIAFFKTRGYDSFGGIHGQSARARANSRPAFGMEGQSAITCPAELDSAYLTHILRPRHVARR